MSQNVRSLSSVAHLIQTATSDIPISGIITNNGSNAVTITGNGAGNFIFGGTIEDGTYLVDLTVD